MSTSRTHLYDDVGRGFSGAFEFVAGFFIFFGLGALLDSWLNISPIFMVSFAILGFAGSFLRFVYADKFETSRRAARGLPPREFREVPEVLREKAAHAREKAATRPRCFGDPVPEELARVVAARRGSSRRNLEQNTTLVGVSGEQV